MSVFLKWLVAALIFCLAVCILGAMLPAPVKKFGLFSLLLGAFVGGGLRQLSRSLGKTATGTDFFLTLILAGLTELGRVWETYRQFLQFQKRQFQKQLSEAEGFASLLAPQLEQQIHTSWLEFLGLRYASLPGFQETGNSSLLLISCLILELLLAAAGAAFAWRALGKSEEQAAESEERSGD